MPELYKILAQSLVPNAATVMYTVPADTQTIVKHITLANPAGNGDVAASLWHNGSTAAKSLLSAVPIEEGGFAENDAPFTMVDGDTIEAMASVDDGLTLTLHGVEITA